MADGDFTYRVGTRAPEVGFIARYPAAFGGTWRSSDTKFLVMPAAGAPALQHDYTIANPSEATVRVTTHTWTPVGAPVSTRLLWLRVLPPTGYTGQLVVMYYISGIVHDPARKHITLGCFSQSSVTPTPNLTEAGIVFHGWRGDNPIPQRLFDRPSYDMFACNYLTGSPPAHLTTASTMAPFYRWGMQVYHWVGDDIAGPGLATDGHRAYTDFIVTQGPSPLDDVTVMDILTDLN